MTPQILEKPSSSQEQRLLLPGYHSWQEFKAIQALMAEVPGVQLTYLDGLIEFITIGKPHELIKSILGFLIEFYLCEMSIPVTEAIAYDRMWNECRVWSGMSVFWESLVAFSIYSFMKLYNRSSP